jgi:hypothetical protein
VEGDLKVSEEVAANIRVYLVDYTSDFISVGLMNQDDRLQSLYSGEG